MSRTKPAEERRADLLAAGHALFVTKGILATTLEDITTRAGVSKGLFYQYYRSKEDLVFALQEQYSSQFADRIRDAADRQHDWVAKLDACVQASFECYRELHDLHEVLFRHGGHGADKLNEPEPAHIPLAKAVQDLLEGGIEAGVFVVDDPETTAVLLCVAMHAFDPAFRSHSRNDADLIRATQQLYRRTAGVPAS